MDCVFFQGLDIDRELAVRLGILLSELTLDEIWSLVDDLIAAHGDYIPPLH